MLTFVHHLIIFRFVNRKDQSHIEKISRAVETVPVWMIKDDIPDDIGDIYLTAARYSFLYKRYVDVLKQEGRYWGEVAHEMLSKGEVPRWVDSRRFVAQYTLAGKGSWVELYSILFYKQLKRLLSHVREKPGPVLDLGCGCGWLSLEIVRSGKDVTGIDVSESSIDLARFFYDNRNVEMDDFKPDFCGISMKPQEKQGWRGLATSVGKSVVDCGSHIPCH